ncbi:cell division protein FtsQ/DivIB [Magnetococcales bacterium HHB-1]
MRRLKSLIPLLIAGVIIAPLIWGWFEIQNPGRFPLRRIQIHQSVHTDVQRALRVLGVPQHTNLFMVDIHAVRKRLISLPWVRDIRVERQWSQGILAIALIEKNAVCTSRSGERLILMDEYGLAIKPLESKDPLILPIITTLPEGEQARHVVWILNILSRHTWLKPRISEAIQLPGGHWILYTLKGIKLLFSPTMEEELTRLHKLQEIYSILDRDIQQIDLRITKKVFIRPRSSVEPSS